MRGFLAQFRREFEQVAQRLQVHQRIGVSIRAARAHRFGRGVVGDQRRFAGEGQHEEFGVAVLFGQRRPLAQHVFGIDQRHDFLHPLERAVLQGDFADHAKGTKRNACCVEQFGPQFATALCNFAIGQDEPHRGHFAMNGFHAFASTMRSGCKCACQRLFVDIGKVGHLLPNPREQWPKRRQFGSGPDCGGHRRRIMAYQPAQPIERKQCALGRHQFGETVPRSDRADRRLCPWQKCGKLCLVGWCCPGGRISISVASPV